MSYLRCKRGKLEETERKKDKPFLNTFFRLFKSVSKAAALSQILTD